MPNFERALTAAWRAADGYLSIKSKPPASKQAGQRFNQSLAQVNAATVTLYDTCDQLGRQVAKGVAPATEQRYWVGKDGICYKTFPIWLRGGQRRDGLFASMEAAEDNSAIWIPLSFLRGVNRRFDYVTYGQPMPYHLLMFLDQIDAVMEGLENVGCWPPLEKPARAAVPRVSIGYSRDEWDRLSTAGMLQPRIMQAFQLQRHFLKQEAAAWIGAADLGPTGHVEPAPQSPSWRRITTQLTPEEFCQLSEAAQEAGFGRRRLPLYAKTIILYRIQELYGGNGAFETLIGLLNSRPAMA